MATMRTNKLVPWAAVAALAAATAPAILLCGAGPAQAGDGGMLAAANAEREKNGCPAWVMSPALQAAAQWHVDDMFKNGTGDGHKGSDGSTPGTRATAFGWTGQPPGEVQAGGGGGTPTPALAIELWNGDGHRNAFSDCTTTDAGAVFQTNGGDWEAVITAAAR
jgi:uncharacterized protein YkwD